MLAFVILDRNSRCWVGVAGSEALGSKARRASARWSDARGRRRGVVGTGPEMLVHERVRVDRQRERIALDGKAEQLGVVPGLSW